METLSWRGVSEAAIADASVISRRLSAPRGKLPSQIQAGAHEGRGVAA